MLVSDHLAEKLCGGDCREVLGSLLHIISVHHSISSIIRQSKRLNLSISWYTPYTIEGARIFSGESTMDSVCQV